MTRHSASEYTRIFWNTLYYEYYESKTLTEWRVNILVTELRQTSLTYCLIHYRYW